MSGPEWLRLRALIVSSVGDDKARNELLNLVERCAKAEQARSFLADRLYRIINETASAFKTLEERYPDASQADPR